MLPKATVLCPNQMKNIWTTRLWPEVKMPKGCKGSAFGQNNPKGNVWIRGEECCTNHRLCATWWDEGALPCRGRRVQFQMRVYVVQNITHFDCNPGKGWKMISALNQVLQFAVFLWIMGRGVRKYNQTASHPKEKRIMETVGIIRATADMAPIFNLFPFHGNQ